MQIVLAENHRPACRNLRTISASSCGNAILEKARWRQLYAYLQCRSNLSMQSEFRAAARAIRRAQIASSAARASAIADSAVTVIKAFSVGLSFSIRSRQARVSSTGEIPSPAAAAQARRWFPRHLHRCLALIVVDSQLALPCVPSVVTWCHSWESQKKATIPEAYNRKSRCCMWEAKMAEMTIAPVATHGFFVDGRWMEDGDIVEIRAPYDGSCDRASRPGPPRARRSRHRRRRQSIRTTRRLPAFERQRVLRRISAVIAERKEEFSRTLAQEAGKPIKAGAHRSRARHLHLQRRRRREHAHLRRISSPRLAGVHRRTLGHRASAFRSARSRASRHSIFRSISSPTKSRPPSPPDAPWC